MAKKRIVIVEDEHRLIKAQQKFAAILKSIGDGVIATDINSRVEFINYMACQLTGYKENEALNKSLSDIFIIIDEETGKRIRNPFSLIIKSGQILELEDTILLENKEGKRIHIRANGSPIRDDKGHIFGAVVVFRDISDRRHTQLKLIKAKEAAESASVTKSQFLANMSHEIRTPMNALIGFAELLHDTHLDASQKNYLDIIYNTCNSLMDLINDILDLSKIEADQVELEEINFDLQYLIESVLKILSAKIREKKIELYYNFEDGMPTSFNGDPTRIRQILLNLLSNAIKFTNEGEIALHVSLDKSTDDTNVTAPHTIKTIRISVKDTGIGVKENVRRTIFEVFSQADMSTTRKYGGTGLGLAISKRLVEMMGGEIWLKSEEGKGSEFIFTLKLKESDPIADSQITPLQLKKLKGKKVVIIDDNENSLRILESNCHNLGLTILYSTTSPSEFLKWMYNHSTIPDIILCDLKMPKIDGYKLAKRIKREEKYKKTKLIAISLYAKIGSTRIMRRSGFDAFLPKPITRQELAAIFQTTLGDKRKSGQIITRHLSKEIALKGIRVLIAEDNATNQSLIKMLLEKYGCCVDAVWNGKEAIQKVQSHRYDIILMDIQMPVMGGLKSTEIIHKKINKNIPIIGLSAAAMKEDQENAIALGMVDYITKPVDAKILKEKILQFVNKE
ncbi:MAG: response regulator [bacterium]